MAVLQAITDLGTWLPGMNTYSFSSEKSMHVKYENSPDQIQEEHYIPV